MKLKNISARIRRKFSWLKRISIKHYVSSASISNHYSNIETEVKLLGGRQGTTIAIVVHLFYTESWESIGQKISLITAFPFDIFVSLPKHNLSFRSEILKIFPSAYVYEAPNRGRDVLPFMAIAEVLYDIGYRHVLKLHSKKSTHRTDGSEWMNDILDSLVPNDITAQQEIIGILRQKNTAIVGPKGQYISLKVNFEANGAHMTRVMTVLYSRNFAHRILQLERGNFGFFAGTMFWVNLSAIKPLISISKRLVQFESENGQIDATFAHAIERLLCVVPESEKMAIFEVGAKGVKKVEYGSGVVPDWSGVYIGPRPKK